MNMDDIAMMRTEIKKTGDWISLNDPGDWFAGIVIGRQTVPVSFEPFTAEELIIGDVTINDSPCTDPMTFRLSRSVLKKELGSDADAPVVEEGWSIYVQYDGIPAGKRWHKYSVVKKAPVDKKAAAKTVEALKAAFNAEIETADDTDIPF